MVTTKVIRRNGQLVPWNHNKIEIAVRKAFLSMEMDSTPAVQVAESVSRAIINDGKQFMHIEDVQNLVEEELMKQGFFKVARSYIQYRALRSKMRESEEQEAALINELDSEQQQALIVVKTADGSFPLGWSGPQKAHRLRHPRPRPLPYSQRDRDGTPPLPELRHHP
jgi:ribonucleoside-diphosphate reductase alpha chain